MVDTRKKRKKLTQEAIAAKKEAEAFETLVLEGERRDWCSPLIEDLLPSIVSFLVTLADFSSFRAVCRKWRSISSDVSPLAMSSQSPLFVLCRKSILYDKSEYFFDAAHHHIYKSPLRPWGIHNCKILGYTNGHLVAHGSNLDMSIILVNVFTGTRIKLPPTRPHHFTHNFIPDHLLLSSSPSSPGCIAVLLGMRSSSGFLYCRLSDPNWTWYQLPPPHWVEDVVFVDNRLYALTTDGRLGFFSFVPHPVCTMLEANFTNADAYTTLRLAESGGDLLVIVKRSFSRGYHIWRVVLEGGCGLLKVDSLGGRALFFARRRFVGSLPASVRSGVTGNSIYQIDGRHYWVYSFDAKTTIFEFSEFPELETFSLPVWILPSLC